MTQLERRLAKLEAELNPSQGKVYTTFADDDGNYETPPNCKKGDTLIVASWISPDEEAPEASLSTAL